jgi:ABC-2 type transport system permease protein
VIALAPRTGSTLWLIVHELRLTLRGVMGRQGGKARLAIVGVCVLVAVFIGGLPLALFVRRMPLALTSSLVITIDMTLAVLFTLILSQTLALATLAFFERGDLELLLSSPLPPSRILAARAVAIATAPFLWFSALLAIPILPLLALGQPRWLAAYPVLAAVALLASSAGIGLTMLLFRLLGARRTKEAGQLIAAVIGAAFFLVIQARNLLPQSGRRVFGGIERWAHGGAFDPAGPLAWPARAVLGEPLALLGFVAVSLLVFTGLASGLGRRFSANAAVAAGIGAGQRRLSTGAVTARGFRGGPFTAILRKEFRLLIRDPTLLSQVLLRTLYVLPLTFAMLKTASHPNAADSPLIAHLRLATLSGSVTFLAGQVAGSLAWISISAEDAPELLVCAPVERRMVRQAKLAAAMIPVAALLTPPLLALVWLSPWVGVCAAFGAAAAALSSGLVNLWLEKPTPRKAFRNRRGGSALAAIAEILVGLGWGATAWLAAVGVIWALIPVAITLFGLLVLQRIADGKPR